jgi:hypothetical protein
MMMSTPNNMAPEPPDSPHNVTFNDDTSSVTEVFNDFNLHDASTATALPATMTTMAKDTGGYFVCPTTPGIMQGHVFFDPALMAFFQHHLLTYPIAHFRTHAEAEDYSRTTFYPPPPSTHPGVSTYNMLMTHPSVDPPAPHTFSHNHMWPQPPETCLPHLAFTFPSPMTPYKAHNDLHIASMPYARGQACKRERVMKDGFREIMN